jgi:hypothetical protein
MKKNKKNQSEDTDHRNEHPSGMPQSERQFWNFFSTAPE